MVEFRDRSVVAQLGAPDMRIPIAHALAWPERGESGAARLDLARIASLTFEAPDLARFPALRVAREALEMGGNAPNILNAANEVAVEQFLSGRIGFGGIPRLVEATLEEAQGRGLANPAGSLAEIVAVDAAARRLACDLLPEIAAKAV
jgi:1-deoxy-D-xylulose-5-phosphate reductoisomerase